ncbi:MAG: preprotein translocase subunit SecE [Gammaproteobacteria bacterium]|nr:preprotein translocase subunit SecE [Gammaproteobacteria bacterium]
MLDNLKLIGAGLVIVAGIAGYYLLGDQSVLVRAGIVIVSVIAAGGLALTSAPGQAAWEFAVGSRLEVRKVVWPTLRETHQGTLVVIVMVIIVGIYLWILDALSFWVIYELVLGTRGT